MTDPSLQHLRTNLAFHTAWVEVGQWFLQRYPHHQAVPKVRHWLRTQQDIIGLLSRALRQQDIPPAQIEPDARILAQAKQRKTPDTLLRYIHHGLQVSHQWYVARLQDDNTPFHDLWQKLDDMQQPHRETWARMLA